MKQITNSGAWQIEKPYWAIFRTAKSVYAGEPEGANDESYEGIEWEWSTPMVIEFDTYKAFCDWNEHIGAMCDDTFNYQLMMVSQ